MGDSYIPRGYISLRPRNDDSSSSSRNSESNSLTRTVTPTSQTPVSSSNVKHGKTSVKQRALHRLSRATRSRSASTPAATPSQDVILQLPTQRNANSERKDGSSATRDDSGGGVDMLRSFDLQVRIKPPKGQLRAEQLRCIVEAISSSSASARNVALRGFALTRREVKRLAEALFVNRNMELLDLSQGGLKNADGDMALLVPALSQHPTLLAVNLLDCNVGLRALKELEVVARTNLIIRKIFTLDQSRLDEQSVEVVRLMGSMTFYLEANLQLSILDEEKPHPEQVSRVVLEGRNLTQLPSVTVLEGAEAPRRIKHLLLGDNKLPLVPQTLCSFKNLRELQLQRNMLTSLPSALSRLRSLRTLDVSYNKLRSPLPDSLRGLRRLVKLDLSHNKLSKFPSFVRRLPDLRILRLHGNSLRQCNIPRDLLSGNRDEALLEAIREQATDQGVCYRVRMLVVGDDGVGKRSLVAALQRRIGHHHHASSGSYVTPSSGSNHSDGLSGAAADAKNNMMPPKSPRSRRSTSVGARAAAAANALVGGSLGHDASSRHASSSGNTHLSPNTIDPSGNLSHSGGNGGGGGGGAQALRVSPSLTSANEKPCGAVLEQFILRPKLLPRCDGDAVQVRITLLRQHEKYVAIHRELAKDAMISLLVFDLTQAHCISRIEYWLEFLSRTAPEAPVVLCGTHADDKQGASAAHVAHIFNEITQRFVRFDHLQTVLAVSSTSEKGVAQLRSHLARVSCELQGARIEAPSSVLDAEACLRAAAENDAEKRVLSWGDFTQFLAGCGVEDNPERMKQAFDLLASLGAVKQYEALQNGNETANAKEASWVVVDPLWLEDAFTALAMQAMPASGTRSRLVRNGLFRGSDSGKIWDAPQFAAVQAQMVALMVSIRAVHIVDAGEKLSSLTLSTPRSPRSPRRSRSASCSPGRISPTSLSTPSSAKARQYLVPSLLRSDRATAVKGGQKKHRRNHWDRYIDKKKHFFLQELGRIYHISHVPADFMAHVIVRFMSAVDEWKPLEYWRNGIVLSAQPEAQLLAMKQAKAQQQQGNQPVGVRNASPHLTRGSSPQSLRPNSSLLKESPLVETQQNGEGETGSTSHHHHHHHHSHPQGGGNLSPASARSPRGKSLKLNLAGVSSGTQSSHQAINSTVAAHQGENGLSSSLGNHNTLEPGTLIKMKIELDRSQSRVELRLRGSGEAVGQLMLSAVDQLDALMGKCLKDVTVQVMVPCTHCLTELPHEMPFLFPLRQCQTAVAGGEKHLQCCGEIPVGVQHLVPDLALRGVRGGKIKFAELEILDMIGEGAFAKVYRGRYCDRTVAVKKINVDRIISDDADAEGGEGLSAAEIEEDKERMLAVFDSFRREAALISALQHHNIVDLLGVVMEGETMCLVLEYMSLGSLYEFLADARYLMNADLRLALALDIASAMQFMHQNKLIHRDIKSPNILLTEINGQVIAKVADFGLSRKLLLAPELNERVVDNPTWLAPEIITNSSYSGKADVYSFAIIMWELLTRTKPYAQFEFMWEIQEAIVNNDRPPVPKTCEKEYARLMKECWDPEPDQRPPFEDIVIRLSEIIGARDDAAAAEAALRDQDFQEVDSRKRKKKMATFSSEDALMRDHASTTEESTHSVRSGSTSSLSSKSSPRDTVDDSDVDAAIAAAAAAADAARSLALTHGTLDGHLPASRKSGEMDVHEGGLSAKMRRRHSRKRHAQVRKKRSKKSGSRTRHAESSSPREKEARGLKDIDNDDELSPRGGETPYGGKDSSSHAKTSSHHMSKGKGEAGTHASKKAQQQQQRQGGGVSSTGSKGRKKKSEKSSSSHRSDAHEDDDEVADDEVPPPKPSRSNYSTRSLRTVRRASVVVGVIEKTEGLHRSISEEGALDSVLNKISHEGGVRSSSSSESREGLSGSHVGGEDAMASSSPAKPWLLISRQKSIRFAKQSQQHQDEIQTSSHKRSPSGPSKELRAHKSHARLSMNVDLSAIVPTKRQSMPASTLRKAMKEATATPAKPARGAKHRGVMASAVSADGKEPPPRPGSYAGRNSRKVIRRPLPPRPDAGGADAGAKGSPRRTSIDQHRGAESHENLARSLGNSGGHHSSGLSTSKGGDVAITGEAKGPHGDLHRKTSRVKFADESQSTAAVAADGSSSTASNTTTIPSKNSGGSANIPSEAMLKQKLSSTSVSGDSGAAEKGGGVRFLDEVVEDLVSTPANSNPLTKSKGAFPGVKFHDESSADLFPKKKKSETTLSSSSVDDSGLDAGASLKKPKVSSVWGTLRARTRKRKEKDDKKKQKKRELVRQESIGKDKFSELKARWKETAEAGTPRNGSSTTPSSSSTGSSTTQSRRLFRKRSSSGSKKS